MTGIFKKCIMSIMIILVIIITAVNMFHYLSNGKKGKEYYIDTFYKNQSFFKEITNSLMEPDNEMYFFKESGEIFLNQNEKNIKLSSSSLDEKTKGNIKRAINKLGGGCTIYKSPTYLEFNFKSNFNGRCISYATDIKELNIYTTVEHLVGNWYYCLMVYE